MSKEEPILIVKRSKPTIHYEVHFKDYIEFRDLEGNQIYTSSYIIEVVEG